MCYLLNYDDPPDLLYSLTNISVVLKPEERRVVPFKFDKASHSQFFITNYLWEQIDTGNDFLEDATAPSATN